MSSCVQLFVGYGVESGRSCLRGCHTAMTSRFSSASCDVHQQSAPCQSTGGCSRRRSDFHIRYKLQCYFGTVARAKTHTRLVDFHQQAPPTLSLCVWRIIALSSIRDVPLVGVGGGGDVRGRFTK